MEKEPEKGRSAKTSVVYKCIMMKCDIDSDVDNKDIPIKIAYNTVDLYVSLWKDIKKISPKEIYIPKLPKCHKKWKILFNFMCTAIQNSFHAVI